jgi:radical SAM superfamily enzyme YgiQ (UPF0313 family)
VIDAVSGKPLLLFLNLPQLDPDTRTPAEHSEYGAACLRQALHRAGERRHLRVLPMPLAYREWDDTAILRDLARRRPAMLACSLYLWNVERTLHVLARYRRQDPMVRIALGGPEVSRNHPFLFQWGVADAVAVGEGEGVFPAIVRAFRLGRRTDFRSVAWRVGGRYVWGRRPVPDLDLADCQPPPDAPGRGPDGQGLACLETTRGCSLRCAYCRYGQLRRSVSVLPLPRVLAQLRRLRRAGAREIRFLDPSLDARPDFDRLLDGMADGTPPCRCFAELRADRVTPARARALAHAGFREIEAGVQSLDPRVLALVRRPFPLDATARGIRRMIRNGIRVTVDFMAGLPGQTAADLRRASRWAATLHGARVQLLQTLLLPGTELRARRRAWGLRAQSRPPYAVQATAQISAPVLAQALRDFHARLGLAPDSPTRRFVGRDLPDLFSEQVHVALDDSRPAATLPGCSNRRALIFAHADLAGRAKRLARLIRRAVRAEPHILWQFVLVPDWEEPLDLLDHLIEAIRRLPPTWQDRWLASETGGKLVSRRVYVRLRPDRRYTRDWAASAEDVLARAFH